MFVIGWLFVAGGIFEALLLVASISFGLTLGPYKPSAGAFIALSVVGFAAAAATAGLGAIMIRTSRPGVAFIPGGTRDGTAHLVVESRAAVLDPRGRRRNLPVRITDTGSTVAGAGALMRAFGSKRA